MENMGNKTEHAHHKLETPLSHILKQSIEIQNRRKTFFAQQRQQLRILKNEILRDYSELDDDFSSLFPHRLQNNGVDKNKSNILNEKARVPEIFIPQHQDQDFSVKESFIIHNQTKVSNQSHQTQHSPIYQNQPQTTSTQMSPRQTLELELTNQIRRCYNKVKHKDSCKQTMIGNEPSEASYNEQNVQSEQSTENIYFVPINSQQNVSHSCQSDMTEEEKTTTTEELTNENKEADQSADSITTIRNCWMSQLADMITVIESDFSQACEVTFELHQSFVRLVTAIKSIKNILESSRNERLKEVSEVTVGNKKITVEDKYNDNQGKKKKKDHRNEDMNEDDGKSCDEEAKNSKYDIDDDGDYDNGNKKSQNNKGKKKKAPKKIRGQICTFVLPEEYDPNDTRWTLKHRNSDPKLNLVELLPQTEVYINSTELAHCKRVAKDSKTLARMLFVEIFSQTALSVCSLTGAFRSNAFYINGRKVRPGLDKHARMVILNFVEEHARQKNWDVFDSQSVINSVRSKMYDMRTKYGRRE